MADETRLSMVQQKNDTDDLVIGNRDRDILRCLAVRVRELASRSIEDKKRDLWYRHNALESTRPVVFCDPENGWNEIITPSHLQCEGEVAREWEMSLRKEIFRGEYMGDDKVIDIYFDIPYVYSETDWGMCETKIGGENGGSYTWDAPLKSYNDLSKIHFPYVSIDYKATDNIFSLGKEVMGDLLTVRLRRNWWWSLGMTWTLIKLRGLEQIMFDMYDYPDQLHQLMGILRDGTIAKLDFLEKKGLLSLNNDGTYVGSGGFGWTNELPVIVV